MIPNSTIPVLLVNKLVDVLLLAQIGWKCQMLTSSSLVALWNLQHQNAKVTNICVCKCATDKVN